MAVHCWRKGFAVVASNLRGLASQAAKASDGIAAQIAHVQKATHDAVEEQSCVTRELSGNMQEVAAGVDAITSSIREIANASQSIDTATKNVRHASQAMG